MTRAEYQLAIREKYLENGTGDIGQKMETYDALVHTGLKIIEHIGSHERPCVSVSGESDSDCIVHLICTYFPEYAEKCRFVFVNTGLEYDATKRHLTDLERKYGITIDRIRGESVVTVVRKRGVPILTKYKAQIIRKYLHGQPHAEGYIFGDYIHSYHAMQFTENQKKLVRHLKEIGANISADCCTYSKKKPLHKYQKEHEIDMAVTGERKAEGGQRAISQSSCFIEKKTDIPKYMPLFWWSDDVKAAFKESEGIRFSDCYEVYGMHRTGCVGCPFNQNVADDLQRMFEYEPRLFKACMNVFGESYRLMDEFNVRRKKCLPEYMQLTLTGEGR